MYLLGFFKDTISERPKTIIAVSIFYFIAGVLEIFSMAMVLPVLMGLFETDYGSGIAEKFLSAIHLQDLSFHSALIWIAIFMFMRGLTMYVADLMIARMVSNLEAHTRNQLFRALTHAKWPYLQEQNLGKIPNLLLRETERYSMAVLYLGRFLSAFLISGALIASSVFASWQMCILFVLSVAPYLIISKLINKRISHHAESRVKQANDISAALSESLLHLKYIKSSGLENVVISKVTKLIKAYTHHFFKAMSYNIKIKYFPEVFGVVIIAVLIIFAKNYIGTSPADIVFFLLLMFRGYRQIANVQSVLANVIENVPSYRACKQMIEASAAQKEDNFEIATLPKGDVQTDFIKITDLKFTYQNQNHPTLEGINITLPKTGLIAFVGLSGAGKSTLMDIILGLVPASDGGIKIAQDHTLNIQKWRKKIGFVPQEPFLISGTILENILMHTDDKSEETLHKVAKIAHIDGFVDKLPNKYDTQIGFINTGLSGGQKQRIALARALAHDPEILILDEATSALDTQTTNAIKDTITEISKRKLVLMIAHNMQMIKDADKIYVLEHGQIATSGTYDTLERSKIFKLYLKTTA